MKSTLAVVFYISCYTRSPASEYRYLAFPYFRLSFRLICISSGKTSPLFQYLLHKSSISLKFDDKKMISSILIRMYTALFYTAFNSSVPVFDDSAQNLHFIPPIQVEKSEDKRRDVIISKRYRYKYCIMLATQYFVEG